MKKKIIELLATKFEGVDDSILARVADTKAAKAVKTEEEAETFVEGITLSKLLNTYGDSRATESQKTAISNYEKQYGLKDGEKVNGGNLKEPGESSKKGEDGDDETPSWAKKLLEDNKKLTERINAMEGEKKASTRKKQLQDVIGKLPESIRKGYERTAINDLSEEEFKELMETIGQEVDVIVKEEKVNGTAFGAPNMRRMGKGEGNEKEASKEEVDAVFAKL